MMGLVHGGVRLFIRKQYNYNSIVELNHFIYYLFMIECVNGHPYFVGDVSLHNNYKSLL